jgi:hypothetical protein
MSKKTTTKKVATKKAPVKKAPVKKERRPPADQYSEGRDPYKNSRKA